MTGETNIGILVDAVEDLPIGDLDPEPIVPMDESRTIDRQQALRRINTFPHHLGGTILSGAEIQQPLF